MLVILAGGAATAALLVLLVKPYLRRATVPAPRTDTADIHARMESGRRHLRGGEVRLARNELDAALQQHQRNPDSLSREESRRLHQLLRESDLLARLLDDPLEQVLRQALSHRNDEEWREKFADYRGRAVVFDDVLRRDPMGRPTLGFYVVRMADVEARVALEDLPLLRQLPLDPPQRWLFGARLADCRREEGGTWAFHFEPDSAVLLTDEDAAAACCPGPLDAELRAALRRQDDWLQR